VAKSLPVSPLAPERFPAIPPVRGARWASLLAGLRYRGRDDLMLLEVARRVPDHNARDRR
jgi:glutamate N-acetyltransferase / amino-acid N-acetyltransferase